MQRTPQAVLEDNLDPGLPRFLIGPCEASPVRRRTPVHGAGSSRLVALAAIARVPVSAAHIQDCFAGGQARETKDPFPKGPFLCERQHPQRSRIRRLVKNYAGRTPVSVFASPVFVQFTSCAAIGLGFNWHDIFRTIGMNMDNCSKSSLNLGPGHGQEQGMREMCESGQTQAFVR